MANRLLTELVLKDENFGQGIETAKRRLNDFKSAGGGVRGTLDQLSKGLGLNISSLTKLGTAAGAAALAFEGMKKVVQHNTGLMDDYDRIQKQVNATVDSFFTCIGNGNFSSFLSGLGDIISKAGEARDALDDLQVTSFYMSNANKQLQLKYRTYMDKARDTSLPKETRDKYLKLARDVADQISKNTKIETQKGNKSNNENLDLLMKKGGYNYKLTDKQREYYLNPQNGPRIERDAATYERIEALRKKQYDAFSTRDEQKKATEEFKREIAKLGGELNWSSSRYARAHAFQSQRGTEDGQKTIQSFYDVGYAALEAKENLAAMNQQMSKVNDRLNKPEKTKTSTIPTHREKKQGEIWKEIEMPDFNIPQISGATTIGYYLDQIDVLKKKLKDPTLTSENYVELQLKLDKVEKQLKMFKEGRLFDIPKLEVDVMMKKSGIKPLSQMVGTQEELTRKIEDTKAAWSATTSIISSVGGAMQQVGDEGVNIAGVIAQAIATIALAYAQTLAMDQASKSNIYSFIAAAAASMISMGVTISQIHKTTGYANGGIIQGSSYSGDRMLARVNSGEMILNSQQQANLWKEINNPKYSTSPLLNGKVEFEIKGQKLAGTLSNYNKKQSRL